MNDVDVVPPEAPLPKLPVARALWIPKPDFKTGLAAWIYAGGAHHTVFSQALDAASQLHFGAPCGYIGQGGTIPLMSQLSAGFPAAQMMVCGVLGPRSNAHGPNEFLHVPYAKRLTAAVAQVVGSMP